MSASAFSAQMTKVGWRRLLAAPHSVTPSMGTINHFFHCIRRPISANVYASALQPRPMSGYNSATATASSYATMSAAVAVASAAKAAAKDASEPARQLARDNARDALRASGDYGSISHGRTSAIKMRNEVLKRPARLRLHRAGRDLQRNLCSREPARR